MLGCGPRVVSHAQPRASSLTTISLVLGYSEHNSILTVLESLAVKNLFAFDSWIVLPERRIFFFSFSTPLNTTSQCLEGNQFGEHKKYVLGQYSTLWGHAPWKCTE